MRDKNLHITLDSLLKVLKNRNIFINSRSSLSVLLKSIGFRYKSEDNRVYLCEKTDVVLKKISFLRNFKKHYDLGNLNIIYLDETWIFAKGTARHLWTDDTSAAARHKTGPGKRFIVVHAGGKTGFVKDASLVFASSSTTGDYHGDMNAEKFENWLDNDMLPKLEEPSLIVLDNASYHSRLVEKQPTSSWTRAQLFSYFEKKNIKVDEKLLRIELLAIARQHLEKKRFVVDEIITKHGHQVKS